MRAIISAIPEGAKRPLRHLRNIAGALRNYGKGRFCPVCRKSSRRFRPFGSEQREEAQCVYCDALERHRFLWLYLSTKTDLFDGRPKTMLHVAPEPCLESGFKEHLRDGYLTADYSDPRAMVTMDITEIEFPDESFNVIYCSHVFEHVQDDRRAMRELRRVMKDDGWAILLVPITCDKTFEDPSIVDPAEREKCFGQEDHVRRYGPDYVDRLREAGFRVEVIRVDDFVPSDEVVRMGLTPASGEIYRCTK
jgi:SAM-dependent methyltransferase